MCFRGGNAMHTNLIYDEHHTFPSRSSLTTPRTPDSAKLNLHDRNPAPSALPLAPPPTIPRSSSRRIGGNRGRVSRAPRSRGQGCIAVTCMRMGRNGGSRRGIKVQPDGRRWAENQGWEREQAQFGGDRRIPLPIAVLFWQRPRPRPISPHHRARAGTYAIAEADAPDFANFSSVGSTFGRAMVKTITFRGRDTRALVRRDFELYEDWYGGVEDEFGDVEDEFGGQEKRAWRASICRDVSPTSPETSHPIQRDCDCAWNAEERCTDGEHHQCPAHAGPGRLQMAESSVMDTCLCSRPSPPHHIQFQIRPRRWMWHLCMRATRFKSESHKRALALRSPPPTSGSKSGSASAVGASGRCPTDESRQDEQREACSQDDSRSPNRPLLLRGRLRLGVLQRPRNCTGP
ncbi:hypothetical protein FIBSPDRAFT_253522 [Athelia psychrophila]|uniref:Uncharacterized protein n=1 Tax=Athelia psychrophila TaxID=1759441 RepID=A0A165XPQ3_9AGAM|nr:hypothetical protein FIBSPDRAFT_253522 [Fibularhizoctonia sp. CBS 109695]